MDYTNSEIAEVIDEIVHRQLYRDILKSRFIDGLRYSDIAEKYDYSDKHVGNIVRRYKRDLFGMLLERKIP